MKKEKKKQPFHINFKKIGVIILLLATIVMYISSLIIH